MTSYTVIMRYRNPARPIQQPGAAAVQITDDNQMTYTSQQVSAASNLAAWEAAIAAYATAWANTQNALFSGTSSQEELPGGVPTYTAAQAPQIIDGVVIAGTVTIAAQYGANYAGAGGAQPFVDN